MKKTKIFFAILVLLLMGFLILIQKPTTFAESCPSNTQVGETSATLVGEVTDDGGDPNLEVWFQYGRTTSYGLETTHFYKTGTSSFCYTVTELNPCTTYHFRAAARNSAGTSYGDDVAFTTNCPLTVDIKANGSDGPITLYYQDYVTLSWSTGNASSCSASGDWSGSKPTYGTESIRLNSVKTYTFTLTCNSPLGQSASDSVMVYVRPKAPQVITKPAVITR